MGPSILGHSRIEEPTARPRHSCRRRYSGCCRSPLLSTPPFSSVGPTSFLHQIVYTAERDLHQLPGGSMAHAPKQLCSYTWSVDLKGNDTPHADDVSQRNADTGNTQHSAHRSSNLKGFAVLEPSQRYCTADVMYSGTATGDFTQEFGGH